VSTALTGADAGGGVFADDDVEPMPDEVALRITAALADERGDLRDGHGAPTDGPAAADPVQPDATDPVDGRPTDELAGARERRRRRLRGWLSAAAVIVVVGGGLGAVAHFVSGPSADTSTASAGAAADTGAASGDESLQAQAGTPSTAAVTANARAAHGALLNRSFVDDAKAFVLAQRQVKPATPETQRLAGNGSSRCATVARGVASSTAGYQAGGGNAAPAAFVGAVTVDGHPGALYLVDVGPVKVAVAMAGCATSSPTVLASATL
jgi:hypothetical protein